MSSFRPLCRRYQTWLELFPVTTCFAHVKRDANAATHALARETVTYVIDKINWLVDVPPCIYGIVSRKIVVPMY